MFLVAGMFDVEQPEATESPAEKISRKIREMAERRAQRK